MQIPAAYRESLFQNIVTHLGLGIHLLQLLALAHQHLHLRDQPGIHADVFSTPFVERGRTDAVDAAQPRHRRADLSLLENGQYLAIGKKRFPQGNLLEVDYEKILNLADTDLKEEEITDLKWPWTPATRLLERST